MRSLVCPLARSMTENWPSVSMAWRGSLCRYWSVTCRFNTPLSLRSCDRRDFTYTKGCAKVGTVEPRQSELIANGDGSNYHCSDYQKICFVHELQDTNERYRIFIKQQTHTIMKSSLFYELLYSFEAVT